MPVKIFFCYAHEDERLLEELKRHLKPLERQGLINMWHDRDIDAGTEWEREINENLSGAQVILLLISSDFMNSDYCYSVEMKRAIERHKRGEARVIPVLLRSVYWQGSPFGKLQALPEDAKAVTSGSWHNRDDAFLNIAEGIHKIVENIIKSPTATSPIISKNEKISTEQDKEAERDIGLDKQRKAAIQANIDKISEFLQRKVGITIAQRTDIGRRYHHNEDNMVYVIPKDDMLQAKKGALFLVADGMGGHAAGEVLGQVASEMAVSTVSTLYYQDTDSDVASSLLRSIKYTNAIIYQRSKQQAEHNGMGTTCVAAVLLDKRAYVANVGDSRAYLVRRGWIRQISRDHSWVAEQVRAGAMSEAEARMHQMRNMITRSLGSLPEVEVDIFIEQMQAGDTLVLCSDGLSGMISDNEIGQIVERYSPQECVHHLIERANARGGTDNITVLVARVGVVNAPEISLLHKFGEG